MVTGACFIAGGVAPGAALEALLGKEALSLAAIDLVCCEAQQLQQQEQAPSCKYSVVLSASSLPHSREALARVARSMAPGGRLYVYESAAPSSSGSSAAGQPSPERLEALQRDLLLSGFVDAVAVSAQLPSWGLGAAAKLSLKRAAPAAPPAAAPAPAAPAAAWKLGGGDDEEELLDEEALLAPEDRAPAAKPDDCEVGTTGRKACKNCTCGRADAEAAGTGVKLTPDMLENPTSACGNCYLGDAFRCASCPYRGLPSFAPGQKISLAADGLAADL
ncbi:hypothetical protein GPECTOR_29g13 [Gonium pectorale]|uniref:Anamorsin homolog n=1 Tax=Gonium pectorale TaxID=33097 RepID=A0A150GF73_GONPE|nr:hypothetical protein GPECTOR_29g13 [Gonium pectorale]|eukprot:KXZ48225.1 hypothetical protein GPECTOR_29g13 [Gonium pectorale]